MRKKILLMIALLIAAVLLFAATRPNRFVVSRSITIKATPARVFLLIDSLPAWRVWSPYEKMDTAMHRTYSGPANGVGAKYAWSGNSSVGEGSMEIIESAPSSRVSYKLEFTKPLAGHDTATFTLTPAPDSTTTVEWAMRGPNPYLGKLMGMMFSMDKMVGDQFNEGLRNLKLVAEH